MKVLYVGDPHIKPECLDEGKELIYFITKTVKKEGVDHVVFLGDLFHTHSIIHLSVLGFWKWAFEWLAEQLPDAEVWALVGNHDMSGKFGDYNHSLMLFHEYANIVDEPRDAPWGALMLPYNPDPEDFVEHANDCKGDNKILICHQTFLGSKYENGIYAKDGVDPNLLNFDEIISGHIHTPQKFGKVWYPGSPRWQTIADANVERAIWLTDHDKVYFSFPTSSVCKPIYSFIEREGCERIEIPSSNASIIVDVIGSEKYVKDRAEELESLGVKVRRFPVSSKVTRVKESDGLQVSFTKFIKEYKSKMGTTSDRIMQIAEGRISWLKG